MPCSSQQQLAFIVGLALCISLGGFAFRNFIFTNNRSNNRSNNAHPPAHQRAAATIRENCIPSTVYIIPGLFHLLTVQAIALCHFWVYLITGYNSGYSGLITLYWFLQICWNLVSSHLPTLTLAFDLFELLTPLAREFQNAPLDYAPVKVLRRRGRHAPNWIEIRLGMCPVSGIPGRTVIVTGGATVVFRELLDEVVTPDFFRAMCHSGIETVLLQCGSYVDQVKQKLENMQHYHLHIQVLAFASDLKDKIKLCRGIQGGRKGGMVISHAGTGTIADCWEMRVANIIVPNPNLMDDHQTVFAQEMARDHPTVVLGRLGHLQQALGEAINVIQDEGLNDLPPWAEPIWPVPDHVRMHFIDNLVIENRRQGISAFGGWKSFVACYASIAALFWFGWGS